MPEAITPDIYDHTVNCLASNPSWYYLNYNGGGANADRNRRAAENGLSQSDISRIINTDRSVVCKILNRKRSMTIDQVNILADYFCVELGLFVKIKSGGNTSRLKGTVVLKSAASH